MQDENVTDYTTRLLSGSAYRRGLLGAFALLKSMRSSLHKANSPENRLDLARIARHIMQSITISVLFASVAIGVGGVQIYLLRTFGGQVEGASLFIVVLLTFVGNGLMIYEAYYYRWAIARKFLHHSYNPAFQPKLPLFNFFLNRLIVFFNKHLLHADPTQNVITFSRYQPFLGSGGQISMWTLAVDRKPAESNHVDSARVEIPIEEFYQAADREVHALALPHLEHLTRLFVDGFELEPDGHVLDKTHSTPRSVLPEQDIWSIGQHELTKPFRAYRLYRYTDSDRDQVLSYYLRFYDLGSITFIESSTHILQCIDRKRFSLTPILKDDKFSRSVKAILLTFIVSILVVPF